MVKHFCNNSYDNGTVNVFRQVQPKRHKLKGISHGSLVHSVDIAYNYIFFRMEIEVRKELT